MSAEIRFVQSASRTVHILPPLDECGDGARISSGAEFADAFLSRTRMLCGIGLSVDWADGPAKGRLARPAGHFEDDSLCQRCMAAMGEDAYLVFEQRLYEEVARDR